MFEKFERIVHIIVMSGLVAIQTYLVIAAICYFF